MSVNKVRVSATLYQRKVDTVRMMCHKRWLRKPNNFVASFHYNVKKSCDKLLLVRNTSFYVCSFVFRRFYSQEAYKEDFTKNHVPLTSFQRTVLAAGSAFISITNPFRGDMIACLGETTGEKALIYCWKQMQTTPEGQRILNQRPRIHSSTVDLLALKNLPVGTVGKTYSDFLEINNVSPDSRPPVRFVEDFELSYVMQRYREVHDIFHAMLLMPTTMLGEVTVKWVEALQLQLPMCINGAIFGAARLRPRQRKLYTDYYLPWAISMGKNSKFLLGIYFEERWNQTLEDFHKEMNIKRLS